MSQHRRRLHRNASPPPPSHAHTSLAPPQAPQGLRKQHSWSPDIYRDDAWLRRKGSFENKWSKSVTDEDLDELKACIELGFGFESSEAEAEADHQRRLSLTLPALELYYAVNKNYNDSISSSTVSDCESSSPLCSPHSFLGPDSEDEAEAMGTGGCLFGAAIFIIVMVILVLMTIMFVCLFVIG